MFLHLSEGVEDGDGVRDVLDGGGGDAPLGHHQRHLTVDVALVGLGQNLIYVSSNVGCDLGEVRSVVEHDGVRDPRGVVHSSLADVVVMKGSQHNVTIVGRLLMMHSFFKIEFLHVKLFQHLTLPTLLDPVGLSPVSLEGPEDISRPVTASDHRLVPELVLVHKPIGLDQTREGQRDVEYHEIAG